MIFSLAWRNIWRNPVRSLIVCLAGALGLFGATFSTSFMEGMAAQTVNAAINTELSNIQIHNPAFIENQEISYTIKNYENIEVALKNDNRIKAFSSRMRVNAMASSARASGGVSIVGIVPESEMLVTDLFKKCKQGQYLSSKESEGIIIGKKLAEKLKVKLNKKIVLTFNDSTNTITGGAFKITGVFSTQNSMFDESTVFVNQNALSSLFGTKKIPIHEIAVKLYSYDQTTIVSNELKKTYPELLIRDWKKIQPEIGMMQGFTSQFMYLFDCIIMGALLFVIVNTMLMAVLERTHEFGMLMAVGMSKSQLFLMVMVETVLLSLFSGLTGIFLGGTSIYFFSKHGIDLSSYAQGLTAMGFDSVVYPVIEYGLFLEMILFILITGILSSVYPAIKALNVDPSQSIRVEL